MRKLDLNDVHALELEALISFDKLCSEYGINYSLMGGTLLGAVRHKGFIPWDDDVDVYVSRPDFDRLAHMTYLASHPEIVLEHYRFDGPGHGTYYPWIRMVDTRTHTELKYQHDEFGTRALFLDIFPVDGVPEDEEVRARHTKKLARMRMIQHLYFSRPGTGKTFSKSVVKSIAGPILRKLVKPATLTNMIEAQARKYPYESSEYVSGAVISDFNRSCSKKKEFEQTVLLEFEGHQLKAMGCWDQWLTAWYGDYMTPVPDYDRHHAAMYIEDWC